MLFEMFSPTTTPMARGPRGSRQQARAARMDAVTDAPREVRPEARPSSSRMALTPEQFT